jgi:hypothetical protein
MDLSYLVDEHTIGVNQAYYCTFPQWGFVPKYFCCSDIHAYKVCMDAYGKTGVETVFIYDYLRAIVGDYPKDFCYDVPRIGEHLWDGASFSSDIETGTNIGKTVVIDLALPAAMYMGFNPIYLIGCDCEPTGHAYPGDKHAQPYTFGHSPCDFESQKKSYQVVREYADMNGIEVYNATSGGKLEAFKRIEYADIWR